MIGYLPATFDIGHLQRHQCVLFISLYWPFGIFYDESPCNRVYELGRSNALSLPGFPNFEPIISALKSGPDNNRSKSFRVSTQQFDKLVILESLAKKWADNEQTRERALAAIEEHNLEYNNDGVYWLEERTGWNKLKTLQILQISYFGLKKIYECQLNIENMTQKMNSLWWRKTTVNQDMKWFDMPWLDMIWWIWSLTQSNGNCVYHPNKVFWTDDWIFTSKDVFKRLQFVDENIQSSVSPSLMAKCIPGGRHPMKVSKQSNQLRSGLSWNPSVSRIFQRWAIRTSSTHQVKIGSFWYLILILWRDC